MSDTHAESTPVEPTGPQIDPDAMQQTRSKLSFRFLRKMALLFLAAVGLGTWGLVDAIWIYPARGIESAEYLEREYLKRGAELGVASLVDDTSVSDPEAEIADLRSRFDELSQQAQQNNQAALFQLARLRWLEQLQIVGRDRPEYTQIESPRERLTTLDEKWTAKSPPSPLSRFDLLFQWIITGVGYGGAVIFVAFLLKQRGKVYRFDPEQKVLTLPGGLAFGPTHIDEFDKRKWRSFILFVKLSEDHPTAGGREIRIDLYRHDPVEEWLKAMFWAQNPDEYRESFPEEFERPTVDEADGVDGDTDAQVGDGDEQADPDAGPVTGPEPGSGGGPDATERDETAKV